MTALVRGGWILCAACFALLLSALLHIDHIRVPQLVLAGTIVLGVWRPGLALAALLAVLPIVGILFALRWNIGIAWTDTLACAGIVGLAIDAARRPLVAPRVVIVPAAVLAAVVITSLIASIGVIRLQIGASFGEVLWHHVTRQYFSDLFGIPGMHAGLRLIEGLALFTLAARRRMNTIELGRVLAWAAGGATLAAVMNILRLVDVARRADRFWVSLIDLAHRLRWNVHYTDYNAAGSYFVLMLLLALALAAATSRTRRIVWLGCTATLATALWLTSSRVAFLAAPVAAGMAALLTHLAAARARAVRFAAVAAGGLAVLALVAVALPQRGTQKSSLVAADVRLGMAETAARMIAAHPVFGIGLGEFYQRSGEFSSPELLALFPPAIHENAHNNFLQIAAELGLAGGLAFTWLIVGPLVALARYGARTRDPFTVLILAALTAFVLTCLGGHPLLTGEPAFAFWTVLGAAAGYASPPAQPGARMRWWILALCVAIAATVPWRMQGMLRDADLEHVGLGVSGWQTSADGTRYREARGHATVFVPAGAAFSLKVNPRTNDPVRVEITLDGRVADIVRLDPNAWNELTVPKRTARPSRRYAPVDLRLIGAEGTAMWITKVQPVQ